MAVLEDTLGIYQLIIQILIYAAIVILLITQKGNERLKTIIMIAGFFALIFFVQNFYIANTFIMLWLLLMDVEFFVDKRILFGLIIIMVILGFGNPFFYFIAGILYIIILVNFFFYSFRQLQSN